MIEYYARQIGAQHYDHYVVFPGGVVMCASEIPNGCAIKPHEWQPTARGEQWVYDNCEFIDYVDPPCQPRLGL